MENSSATGLTPKDQTDKEKPETCECKTNTEKRNEMANLRWRIVDFWAATRQVMDGAERPVGVSCTFRKKPRRPDRFQKETFSQNNGGGPRGILTITTVLSVFWAEPRVVRRH
jgi:hypothetical protein